MQINSSNFAQTYQTIRHTQIVSEKPTNITPEQKRTTATTIIDFQQTKDNVDTYVQSYQSATGNDSSTSSDNLNYSDIKDINQTITRHQVANSDALSNYIDRQQEGIKPAPYYQAGLQNQAQTGSMINTYA